MRDAPRYGKGERAFTISGCAKRIEGVKKRKIDLSLNLNLTTVLPQTMAWRLQSVPDLHSNDRTPTSTHQHIKHRSEVGREFLGETALLSREVDV